MGIPKHGHPVRRHVQDLMEGLFKPVWGLFRQSIHQIHIHAGKPESARMVYQGDGIVGRLEPVNTGLNLGRKVLYPDAHFPKPHIGKGFQLAFVGGAGVQFGTQVQFIFTCIESVDAKRRFEPVNETA